MPDCIGIPNSNEYEMHEKGNWKERLIVSEWKSGLEDVVSGCKCKGRGLMVLPRTARGTKIVHLIIISPEASELCITRPEGPELSTCYLLGSSPSWGRWCCWQNDHLPIWTLLAFMLPLPYTVLIQHVCYCQPRKDGGNQHSKRKRESDKTDSFPLFVIFQFNSVTEDRKAD